MKTALIITTINIPKVLALYRKLGPDVKFFVAADEKTPLEAYEFCANIPNCEIYSPERQKELGYECSALIGWNNDSRRNIALLEAVKDKADIIVSVDDDMIPRTDFFAIIEYTFSGQFHGAQFGSPGKWFDAGQFTYPPARQRGLPFSTQGQESSAHEFVSDVMIGAMQGIILGVPDTDAVTAISQAPFIKSASDILHNSFVVHPEAHSVFNSQLTAFRRELAPCFAQFYQWQGRNTDIFASLIMRRVMRELNLHAYFGPPAAFHARTKRDLSRDLEAEKWGVEHVEVFASLLDAVQFPHNDMIENLRVLYRSLAATDLGEMGVAALAFLDDMEKVL